MGLFERSGRWSEFCAFLRSLCAIRRRTECSSSITEAPPPSPASPRDQTRPPLQKEEREHTSTVPRSSQILSVHEHFPGLVLAKPAYLCLGREPVDDEVAGRCGPVDTSKIVVRPPSAHLLVRAPFRRTGSGALPASLLSKAEATSDRDASVSRRVPYSGTAMQRVRSRIGDVRGRVLLPVRRAGTALAVLVRRWRLGDGAEPCVLAVS